VAFILFFFVFFRFFSFLVLFFMDRAIDLGIRCRPSSARSGYGRLAGCVAALGLLWCRIAPPVWGLLRSCCFVFVWSCGFALCDQL